MSLLTDCYDDDKLEQEIWKGRSPSPVKYVAHNLPKKTILTKKLDEMSEKPGLGAAIVNTYSTVKTVIPKYSSVMLPALLP